MEALGDGEVDVWLARPTSIEQSSAAAFAAILSSEERERARSLRFPNHRREYVASHALLRVTLARYALGDAGSLTFTSSPSGRPALAGGPSGLDFSLSRTDGLAAVAVSRAAAVGIDTEDLQQPGDYLDVADRYFAPGEVRGLRGLPPELRERHFLELWTLKEAYAKACGTGLSLPLDRVAFSIRSVRQPYATFSGELADERGRWQFALLYPTVRHVVAVARSGMWPLLPRLRFEPSPLFGEAGQTAPPYPPGV
jgi:4'-phosphopantetheinyl transferase